MRVTSHDSGAPHEQRHVAERFDPADDDGADVGDRIVDGGDRGRVAAIRR